MSRTRSLYMRTAVTSSLVCFLSSAVIAQQTKPAQPKPQDNRAKLDKVTASLGNHSYVLSYKHTTGQVLRYDVVHVVNVETTIEGSGQKSVSRSAAVKKWEVQQVTPTSATLAHSIEHVDMYSESPGRARVHYDSRTDKVAPPDYEEVAKQIGKPLAVLTVDRFGNTLDRKEERKHFDLGAGALVLNFPKEPIKIGAEWSQPGSLNVRLVEGDFKQINIRQLYRLENVASGIATISVSTQVMTPVPDARVQSQLIQRLCNGHVKFDIDAGHIVSKTMEWNETVVGFSGASSSMHYQAKLNEELIRADRVATRP